MTSSIYNRNTSTVSMGCMLKILSNKQKGLKVCHLNAQSLKNKIDEFKVVFENSDVDIICVSETWLKPGLSDNTFSMSGYKLIRVDRSKHGGGVAVFLKNGICFKELKRSSENDMIEYVLLEICSQGEKIMIGAAYRPNRNIDFQSFCSVMQEYSTVYNNIIITGDFNADLLTDSTISNVFDPFGLSSVNKSTPTHFTTTNNSLLDLFLVDNISKVKIYDQLLAPCFSRHDLIFMTYDFLVPVQKQNIRYRDFTKINIDYLETECNKIQWDSIYSFISVNEQVSFLQHNVVTLYNTTVPIKTKTILPRAKPWFSNEIELAIKKRDTAFTRWKQYRTTELHMSYKLFRKNANNVIKKAKANYYASKFNTATESKKKWSSIREIGIGKSKCESTSQIDVNALNAKFLDVPSTVSNNDFYDSSYSHDSQQIPFSFRCVDQTEVLSAILKIKSNAEGPDDINPKFIKLLLPRLLNYITYIFNSIFTTSCFPTLWKTARIVPIPKSNSDFRPIAILPYLSKVFERLAHSQMYAFLNENSLLSNNQSGFRPNNSCITALTDVCEDIRNECDSKKITFLVLLDHSKAFDTVNHDMLCFKLKNFFQYSVSATNLLHTYLSNRSQYVQSENLKSSLLCVKQGVPQGSILGPLLFSMYANDLPNQIEKCKIRMYADDVQIYISCTPTSADKCVNDLNNDLNKIYKWATANSLTINPVKSKCIVIGKNSNLPIVNPLIVLNNQRIEIVKSAKNLGIILNQNLTWTNHVNSICGRTSSMLRSLYNLQYCTPIKIRVLLVKSYIMPVLLYGCELFSNADGLCKRKLCVAFNNVVRYVYGLKRYDHVSQFSKLLYGYNFESLMKIRTLSFLHKIIYCRQPTHLYERIIFSRSNRGNNIILYRHNTRISEQHFFIYALRLWNSLPNIIQLNQNSLGFKKEIIKFFES